LRSLKARGFQPTFAVDVGAYHGQWTEMFKDVYPSCSVLMIEAQSKKAAILERVCQQYSGSVRYRNALLGAISGRGVPFFEMETGSSVFEERSPYAREQVMKTTSTLDEVLRGEVQLVDFLKLDVQGYELEVLKGAQRTLMEARCVLLETSIIPVNAGAPLIAEVLRYMDEQGYQLADFCSQMRMKDGVLFQTDLLFWRTDSGLIPEARLTPENWV